MPKNKGIIIDSLIDSTLLETSTENNERMSMLKITGASVLPKQTIKDFLIKKNSVAPYWVIDLYYDLEKLWGIRADVLICQMFYETGYMTSWWFQPERRNMAGIGITGETSKAIQPGYIYDDRNKFYRRGITYPTYTQAVQAHFAHMIAYTNSSYVLEAPRWDSRYDLVFDINRGKPTVMYTSQLNGRWTDGANYGESIEGIYNTIYKSV